MQATHFATFAAAGFSGTNDDTLIIDGTAYKSYNLASQHFRWEYGSTHTVQALPVKNYDTPQKGFSLASWTNGNGLVGASGTFTMPNTDVTVTANYAQSTVQVTFATSGLSNQNAGVTILTIDGVTYDYFQIANINFQWEKNSQHTVTAATSVTGWDSATRYFSSWSNGNGLTTNTGTFTTPTSNVAVTVNYGAQAQAAATTLTVTCSVDSVDSGNPITVSGTLTSSGAPVAGKTITVTYYDGVSWVSIGSATTQANGGYSLQWTIPASLPNGEYPVRANFLGDSNYQSSMATTGSGGGNGPLLFVTPETPIGGIVALIACFGGALAFFKLRSKRSNA